MLRHALSFCPLCLTDTETAFAQSPSITPSVFGPALIHLSPSPSRRSPSPAEHGRDNVQQFQSEPCEDLAQPFASLSIRVMRLKQHGELHFTDERKAQHSHAKKDATITHREQTLRAKRSQNINPYNDAMVGGEKKIHTEFGHIIHTATEISSFSLRPS